MIELRTKTIDTTMGEITFGPLKRKDMKAMESARRSGDDEQAIGDAVTEILEGCIIDGREKLDELVIGEYVNLMSEIQKFSSEYVQKN